MGNALEDFYSDLLRAPNLLEAACCNHVALFDLAIYDQRARQEAIEVCNGCPALTECQDWERTLEPGTSPYGAVGGVIRPLHRVGITRRRADWKAGRRKFKADLYNSDQA